MGLFPARHSGGTRSLGAAARDLVVLDTSAVSLLFRGGEKSSELAEQIRGKRAVISFQTLEEVRFGAYKAGWGERRINDLNRHLRQYEVIWPNPELVEVSARLRVRQQETGRRLATGRRLDCRDRALAQVSSGRRRHGFRTSGRPQPNPRLSLSGVCRDAQVIAAAVDVHPGSTINSSRGVDQEIAL